MKFLKRDLTVKRLGTFAERSEAFLKFKDVRGEKVQAPDGSVMYKFTDNKNESIYVSSPFLTLEKFDKLMVPKEAEPEDEFLARVDVMTESVVHWCTDASGELVGVIYKEGRKH